MLLLLHCIAFVGTAAVTEECVRSNGVEYRGDQQITSTGKKCLNWRNAARHYSAATGLDVDTGIWDHSFCRNPDASEKPWCFVIGRNGTVQRQYCVIEICRDETSGRSVVAGLPGAVLSTTPGGARVVEPAQALPVPDEGAAVLPATGPSHRVRTGPARKKDLGIVGSVLGIVMMTLIILLGVGITVGYFYKRGRALQRQHEQRVYEQEMRRLALPHSAFPNPACQLLDEGAGTPLHTPAEDKVLVGGAEPVISQVVMPGA